MLVICPNCKTEFIIHDELTGECPVCGLKLLFKGENEIIERVYGIEGTHFRLPANQVLFR